ncbi:hypothetical protein [Kineosporia sp. A_224]|uniref:hypothetical protein n=1 Tax=Kineosporia sp. A_224 TaxID=1962180 RepID=UPI000B4A9D12|nr:hypothetical protein [Kineosporia sp. A_224]MBI4942971.1 hypothetical protein [Actinomycetota bacterium]
MYDDQWTDDELLSELGEALRAEREVPGALVDAGKAIFTWRSIDAELTALTQAHLTYDSFADDAALQGEESSLLVGVRSEQAALRSLTFAADDLSIELEVTDDGVLGQLVPPQSATVEVLSPDSSRVDVPVDEVGWFTLRPVPTTRFRLTCHLGSGASVVTDWISL